MSIAVIRFPMNAWSANTWKDTGFQHSSVSKLRLRPGRVRNYRKTTFLDFPDVTMLFLYIYYNFLFIKFWKNVANLKKNASLKSDHWPVQERLDKTNPGCTKFIAQARPRDSQLWRWRIYNSWKPDKSKCSLGREGRLISRCTLVTTLGHMYR